MRLSLPRPKLPILRPRLPVPRWAAQHLPIIQEWLGIVLRLALRGAGAAWDWLSPPIRRTVLKPYTKPMGRLRGAPLGLLMVLFCFIWGAAFALLAPYLVVPLLIPLALLGLVVLWALPETDHPPIRALEWLFTTYVVVMVVWPDYLAPNVPGFPRISLQRMLNIPLLILTISCISMSKSFRVRIKSVLMSSKYLFYIFIAFLTLQVISIFYSKDPVASAIYYINAPTNFISLFTAGLFLLSVPGRPTRIVAIFCTSAVILVLIGLLEYKMQKIPWADHIPSFLQVSDPNVAIVLAGDNRLGKGHRVQGPFHTAPAYSQYLALCVPFLLYFATERFPKLIRVVSILMIPVLIMVTVFTKSRTGLVGVLVTFLLFPVFRVAVVWMRDRRNMLAASALFSSPLAVLAGLAAAYVIPAIHVRVFGGGAEQISNNGRSEQIHMGIPLILSHPWGYGLGQGAVVLNYVSSRGQLTIDSFPLRMALELGVLGPILYYPMNALFALRAAQAVITKDDDREFMLLVPLAIAVVGYTAMQLNFDLDDNEPAVYIIYAMIFALIYMAKLRQAKAKGGSP